jgi:hypothetical protein
MHLRRLERFLDDVIRKRHDFRRNLDPERVRGPEGLRGVEVRDQLEPGGLHNRQIDCLLASANALPNTPKAFCNMASGTCFPDDCAAV